MTSNEDIYTPANRSAPVWKHFGFKKDSSGRLLKDACAICKQCKHGVAHGGGTINLRSHLQVNHPSLYDKLVTLSKDSQCEGSGSKKDKMDRFLHPFTSGEKLSSSSQHTKMLSNAMAEFIARDMRPGSVVDGLGILNLMHVVEPWYITPCRKTVMELIEWKYSDLKRDIVAM